MIQVKEPLHSLERMRTGWRAAQRLWIETRKLALYGRQAPRFNEVIEVETAAITQAIPTPLDAMPPVADVEPATVLHARLRLRQSHDLARASVGCVIGDTRYARMAPVALETLFKIRCCHDHWIGGVPWRETGIYEIMLRKIEVAGHVSGYRTIDDLRRRYEQLDRIFDQAAAQRGLRPPEAVGASAARDGIEVHLGSHGEPIFGGCGTHRMAIAGALKLPQVPVVLGFVHRNALPRLVGYRVPRSRHVQSTAWALS